MDITVSVLKDAAEVVKATSEAIKALVEALGAAVAGGGRGLERAALRRERRRLVDLSVRLTILAGRTNYDVTSSLDEYLALREPSDRDWLAILETFDISLVEVQEVLADFEKSRDGFVLDVAYVSISEGLYARTRILEQVRSLERPTGPDAVAQLHRINAEYKKLRRQMRKAVRALNEYIGEEHLNRLSDEQIAVRVSAT
jgi:uncharacterized membrane protein YccC